MEEKILKNCRKGMPVLLLVLLSYVAAIGLCILGAVWTEEGVLAGGLVLALSIAWLSLGWIFLCGLKVIKPQEALVLTLFGKYVGTLRGEGFYYVNPFCTGVNPAAKTRLKQSGDVDGQSNGALAAAAVAAAGAEAAGKKISLKIMTLNNNRQKDQRLPGQSGGNRHRRHVAGRRYRQSGVQWTTTKNICPSVTALWNIDARSIL